MNEKEKSMDSLLETHRGWARWSLQRLRIQYLEIDAELYERDYEFNILVRNSPVPFPKIREHFSYAIRPASASIKLVEEIPAGFLPLPPSHGLISERWLVDEPLPTGWINKILSLAVPDLPDGGIDFLHDKKLYVFRHFGLTDEEFDRVELACREIGIPMPIEFIEEMRPESVLKTSSQKIDPLDVSVLRNLRPKNLLVKNLLERDEDQWRTFVNEEPARQSDIPRGIEPSKFACLYDLRDNSDVQLSELMTIYDVVNVIPTADSEWLNQHRVSLSDVEELVSMGRLRLVLPESVERYPEDLVTAVARVDASALTLTRSLAAKAIRNGAKKDPLLYGPFPMEERLMILRAIHDHSAHGITKQVFKMYGALLEQQHRAFALRGANACYGVGIGVQLSNIFKLYKGIDAQIELSTIGAAIEWAMGLGAVYIPRQIGGFDETNNASIFASYVNRTKAAPKEPLGDRMHTVVEGLLGVSDIPPIEVARNLSARSLTQFRQVANRLISGQHSTEEIPGIVARVNDEVKAFERRRQRLVRIRMDTALLAAAGKPILDLADTKFGGWTSYFTSYAAALIVQELTKTRAGDTVRKAQEGLTDALLGLALAPSNDAVIIWRARHDLAD